MLVIIMFPVAEIRDGLATEGRSGAVFTNSFQWRAAAAPASHNHLLPGSATSCTGTSAMQVHENLLTFCLLCVCQLLCSMFNSLNGSE